MCGRFTRNREMFELERRFGLKSQERTLARRFNLAPGQQVEVIVSKSTLKLTPMQWGLIPHWSKDPKTGFKAINARAETLTQKPSFKGPLKNRRCLIPADGFYEWQSLGKGRPKTPFYYTLSTGGLFGLAGLWDQWQGPEGEILETFTIITTEANPLVAKVHPRMPVILPRHLEREWLDPNQRDSDYLVSFLQPYPEAKIKVHPVSGLVNSVKNDSPACIEPVEQQKNLFSE